MSRTRTSSSTRPANTNASPGFCGEEALLDRAERAAGQPAQLERAVARDRADLRAVLAREPRIRHAMHAVRVRATRRYCG
jgi:hypothetical protein